jgi:hypothetical protein
MSEEQRLREIFAALEDVPNDGADCPAAERIIDSADGRLGPEENRDIIRHIGECAACSTAWWVARETGEKAEASSVRTPVLRGWPALAAAAVLVLMVGIVGHRLLQPRHPTEPVYRVQEETWLTSQLPADLPLPRDECILRWAAGPPGTGYDITVTDENLTVLASAMGLSDAEYRVGPDALSELSPGESILWRVTARLPDGNRERSATFTSVIE